MLYNYADDNNVSDSDKDMDVLKTKLEESATIAVKWFHINDVEAGPTTFQGTIIPHGSSIPPTCFNVSNIEIPIESNVKMLGIFIDTNLKFAMQITEICIKATRSYVLSQGLLNISMKNAK